MGTLTLGIFRHAVTQGQHMMHLEAPNSVPQDLPVRRHPGTGINPTRPGTGNIWTVEGDSALEEDQPNQDDNLEVDSEPPSSLSPTIDSTTGLTESDTKILLEKEFDDYYEDRVHKSAGPVVFLSKALAMLPVIWTEDDAESDCKTYFNLYTFIVFLGWIGLAVITGSRIDKVERWPAEQTFTGDNMTEPQRFLGQMTMDTYVGSLFTNCLVAVLFGIFKCTTFAEVLFTTSEIDSQLELKEKHYDKIKRKTIYWIVVELILLMLHMTGVVFLLEDIQRDLILLAAILFANLAVSVLDLQYVHLCMVLCKRYRMLNKIIGHITKPFKTFRSEEPSNEMLQKILSYRWETAVTKEEASNAFDQIWEPSEIEKPSVDITEANNDPVKVDISKEEVPPAVWMKGNEKEISRDEEATVTLQLDILRGIHSDLHSVGQQINQLVGFQMLVNLMSNVVILTMFGFYTAMSVLDGKFYWPFLVVLLTPALRVMLIGHWAQVMKDTSMKPFWTISHMSTLDGSPKLERQVQKFSLQASQKTARMSGSGYFYITRNTITRIFGLCSGLIFLLVKFDRLERASGL